MKVQSHRAWLGILDIHIDQQVVGRVESHQTINTDTRIGGSHTLHVTDTFAIDHQLQLGVLHAHKPVGGFYVVDSNFLGATHRHRKRPKGHH